MRIGFIQMTPEFGCLKNNVAKAIDLIRQTEADFLVLPELFNSGYLFIEEDEVTELSESIPDGYTTQALLSVSEETGTSIAAGIPERDGDLFYNSAILYFIFSMFSFFFPLPLPLSFLYRFSVLSFLFFLVFLPLLTVYVSFNH